MERADGRAAMPSPPESGRAGFTISDAAQARIRARGGELWIWPGDDRRPSTSSRPPTIHETEWTTCSPDGLVIHVDSRIVPPEDDPEPPSSPLAHVRTFLVVHALAWIFAVLWALRFVGVSSNWLSTGRALLLLAEPVVG